MNVESMQFEPSSLSTLSHVPDISGSKPGFPAHLLGIQMRRFWQVDGVTYSGVGVLLVAAVVVAILMLAHVIHIPVAISMISSLAGGWMASALGVSLARDGWRGAVINVTCGLAIFLALNIAVHSVVGSAESDGVSKGPAPMVSVSEPGREYIDGLPADVRPSALQFMGAVLNAISANVEEQGRSSSARVAIQSAKACLSKVAGKQMAQDIAGDLELLAVSNEKELRALKQVKSTALQSKLPAANCAL